MRIYLLLALFCFSRCVDGTKSHRSPIAESTINNVKIHARFIRNDSTARTGDSNLRLNNGTKENDPFLYFNIRIEPPGFEEDKKTTAYLDFNMGEDFRIIEGQDTLSPLMIHRVANGQKGKYEYIVIFKDLSGAKNESLHIIYDDKIFGIGRQLFEFQRGDI